MRLSHCIVSIAALAGCALAGYYFASLLTAHCSETASVAKTTPLAEDVVAQIIPLPNNLHAVGRGSELTLLTSRDVDVTSSVVVIEDTSAKIERMADMIAQLEAVRDANTVTEYRQLKHAEAGEMVRLLDATFGPAVTGGAGGETSQPTRLFVGFDAHTNAVVLIGRKEELKPALDLINTVEGEAATRPATGTRPVTG
jgi:hypothetical protein